MPRRTPRNSRRSRQRSGIANGQSRSIHNWRRFPNRRRRNGIIFLRCAEAPKIEKSDRTTTAQTALKAPMSGMTTNGQTAKTKNTIFQLTHPRGGRLDGNFVSVTVDRVSIRAPARSATLFVFYIANSPTVSIHAPARGATLIPPSFVRSLPLFQFTHPRGVRLALKLV